MILILNSLSLKLYLLTLQDNIQYSKITTRNNPMNSQPEDHEAFFKIIVVGDAGVGKTNMIYVFDKGRKPLAVNPTIGVQFTSKTIPVSQSRRVRTQIWDTAGQQQFRALTMNHYRGAAGAFIVFDITNRNSFDHVKQWFAAINERSESAVQIALIGHKCDVTRRAVSRAEGQQYAKQNKIMYFETSTSNPESIRTAFTQLISKVAENQEKKIKSNSFKLEQRNEQNSSGCKC